MEENHWIQIILSWAWSPRYTGGQSRMTETCLGYRVSSKPDGLLSRTLTSTYKIEVGPAQLESLLCVCEALDLIPIATQLQTKKRYQTLLQVFCKYITMLSIPMVTTALERKEQNTQVHCYKAEIDSLLFCVGCLSLTHKEIF